MLKPARIITLATALLAAGTASAIPVTDFVNPSPDLTITTGAPYVFTHDMTDGLDAFMVGFDTITSAILSVHLIDFVNKGKETFSFTIGNGSAAQTLSGKDINNGSQGVWFEIPLVAALHDLVADGKLNVTLTATSGSYEFADSRLTAEIMRGVAVQPANPTVVPEPGSLLLLGAGLFGIGMTGRRALRRTTAR